MSEDIKKNSPLEKVVFLVASVIAFATTLYLLFNDFTASATVAAALTMGMLLFHFLPIVESFEVLGLKAKLNRRVGEADSLLSHIKNIAEVSSKLLYIQLAWMNRMGTISWSKKRDLLSEVDGLLKGLDVSRKEIENLKHPFMVMISLDLFRIFEHCLRFRSSFLLRQIEKEQHDIFKGRSIDQSNTKWKELQNRRHRLKYESYSANDVLSDSRLRNIGDMGRDHLANVDLPKDDREALEGVVIEIAQLADECWREGTITRDAEVYLERYGHSQDARYKELFGDCP